MATAEQIKKIHTLKTVYNLSDELYRGIIYQRFCKESSKQLTEEQASTLIKVLIALTGDTYESDYDEQENAPEQFLGSRRHEISGEKLKKVIYDMCEMLPKNEILKVFINKTTIEQNKHIIRELLNKVEAEAEA